MLEDDVLCRGTGVLLWKLRGLIRDLDALFLLHCKRVPNQYNEISAVYVLISCT